jgi:protoporphyrinogen oxidase
MREPHIVVLGGGPAGCGAAFKLRERGKARVTLVEQSQILGGNSGSLELEGQFLDFGSHRLHSACDPAILEDIGKMLGDDLAHRDRHGRIRLRGKWLHFPLRFTDLMLRLDKVFAIGAAWDMVKRVLGPKGDEGNTFASVLEANLGHTICKYFYFPYARKLWGHEPQMLSGIQARKRVSAGSVSKILKRLAKPPGAGKFYYPRRGYGQISEAYAEEGQKLGAEVKMGWSARKVTRMPDGGFEVEIKTQSGEQEILKADHIWSTIPVTILSRMIEPPAPAEVVAAADKTSYRSMVLVYLTLPVDQWTTTDAHYFPEENIRMTRISEPKNYFGLDIPKGKTTICAELPCERDDKFWNMSDEELGDLILEDIATADLPVHKPLKVFSKRLPQAYPIYTMGYENDLEVMDSWINSIPNMLIYGRQGFFAHDNTHHALFMAYSAVDCLDEDGSFNHQRWAEYREIFATHVVED